MSKKWREIHRRIRQESPLVEAFFLQKYPKAFFPKDSPKTEPLAIGARLALARDNPQIEWLVISEVVEKYVKKDRYQRALATRPNRLNLDGSIFGPVKPEHRERAIEELVCRQKNRIAREAA